MAEAGREPGSRRREGGPPVRGTQLPKGGGAIRGIDESVSVNPATGTASVAVPLPVSPGRPGATPELSLTYDSGAGNGPFGAGWSLRLPSVTRKTDTGVPAYAGQDT